VAQERAAAAVERGAELQILLKLFEMLSTIELYRARGNIFKYYCAVYGKDRTESDEKRKKLLAMYFAIREDVRKVEGAFDQAGVLVIQKKVDQKLFL
jgi:hypothetical protein